MNKKTRKLIIIIILAIFAVWVDIPSNTGLHLGDTVNWDIATHLGLDLVGGVQALLEADMPPETDVTQAAMDTARTIIENRANGLLGVGEAVVQSAGDRRIVVELPGETDPEAALRVLGETGQLEFVDFGNANANQMQSLEGTQLLTDYPLPPEDVPVGQRVYHTVMTGEHLSNVGAGRNSVGEYEVDFQLDTEGARIFREYTSQNVGSFLAIVLDKNIISIPRVNTAITGGRASISGNFTFESANDLAVKLRYGSLPVPLKVMESRTIGPSLGQDSLQKSLVAGLIGFGLVVVFMAGYYRLPGLLADIALLLYAAVTFALFKLIPVTLTLPGIAGFVLSIGVAVDANILIFERLKEELKDGVRLNKAIDLAWDRAWPSIRDSNLATLITCAILFWFGSAFGASMIKGFAVTLALGVGVSLFTAINVTRTLLHLWLDKIQLADHRRWFGV
ncbi:MAG: protein translocase subunit SecD [Anaerolineales bacterium]|nr:protein translocase subunit SecD [Anaerolineales bacterium]